MLLLEDRRFYVYVYLDTRKLGKYKYGEYEFTAEPFYIGKGCGGRDKCHLEYLEYYEKNKSKIRLLNTTFFFRKLRKMFSEGFRPNIIKIKNYLTNVESLKFEVEMIKTIGRSVKNEGPLTNITPGGDGKFLRGTFKNCWGDEEYREKIIDASRNNWKIIYPDDSELVVRDLHKWCKENPGMNYSTCKAFSSSKKVYKGFCIINLDRDDCNLTRKNFRTTAKPNERERRYLRGIYKITYPDGNFDIIRGLKDFCQQNYISSQSIRTCIQTNKSYHGLFKIEKLKSRIRSLKKVSSTKIKGIDDLNNFVENSYTLYEVKKLNIPTDLFEFKKIGFHVRVDKKEVDDFVESLRDYRFASQISEKFHIHNLKLSHWERSGLLVPTFIRDKKVYLEKDIERLVGSHV